MYLDDAFLGLNGGANLIANANFEAGSANWHVEAPFSIQNVGGSNPTNTPVPPTNTPMAPTATRTPSNSGLTIYGDSTTA